MQKKKILHLITGLEVGGAEMMLLKTLPHLQDDFDNRVCCIRGRGQIGKELEKKGLPVYYLDLNNFSDIGNIFRLKKIIKEFNPALLITYLIHADLFGRIFGRLFGVKKILCNQRGKLLQWNFLRYIDRATKSLVTQYVVQTEVAKQELMQSLCLSEERFYVIPNSIDVKVFNHALNNDEKRKDLGLLPGNIIITCVSKLRRGKGHEYLLHAFEELSKHSQNIRLLIVGDGEKKEELSNQISCYSSKNNIFFLGERNDVEEILKISDIFVLPTLGEGMSNAIMEAMAAELPVITTNISENKALIQHEKNGLLVPPKDAKVLAQALKSLVFDKQKRNILGINAKQHIIKNFELSVVTKKLSSYYQTL